MNLQVVDIISFLYLISGIVALFLSVFVFRSRQKGYQLTLAFLFLSGAWWSLSMFFENFSAGIQGHIFWNVVSYPAIMSAPVLLFLFLYEYTHHNKTVYWWLKTILFVVPLVSSFFVALPGFREIVWINITVNHTPLGEIAHFEHGWWYYVEAYYSYALVGLGIFLLARALSMFSNKYSKQVIILLSSSVVPLVLNVVYSFNSNYLYGLDLTPIAFIATSFLFYLAVSRSGLLSVIPIGWNVVFENIQEGVLILVDDKIVDINPSAKKIFNIKGFKNLVGTSIRESLHEWKELNDFLFNAETSEKEKLSVGGQYYKLSKNKIRTGNQETLGQVVFFNNVTDIVKNENEISAINTQLRKANETKDLLFRVISHDLKGSVGTINSLLEFHSSEGTLPGKKELNALYSTSSNLSYLTDNLLHWANSQQNEIQINPGYHTVSHTVSNVIQMLKNQASSKGIKLINDCPEDVTAFYDDPSIEIVIRNLISNSIKFSHPDGKIEINLTQSSDAVSIHVIDYGIGISKEIYSNINRNIFVDSEPGTLNEKGTGIGLTLCMHMVNKNNGALRFKSKQNIGTTVSIKLPANG